MNETQNAIDQRTQDIIDDFRGLPLEYGMLKGLLCLDIAVEHGARGRAEAQGLPSEFAYDMGREAVKVVRGIFNTMMIAERMDEINAEVVEKHKRKAFTEDAS